jgi:metallo-beta-lactamase class B
MISASKSSRLTVQLLTLVAVSVSIASAQNAAAGPDPSAAPSATQPPGSAAANSHRAAADQAAGTRWPDAYKFLCAPEPHLGNSPNDPAIEPQKIFDNVSIFGDRGTVIYAIRTTRGVILIDSSYPGKTTTLVLPALTALGIAPTDVKYILVSHGHADHFGGAQYFQSHYGTKIVASDADWAIITSPPTRPAPAAAAQTTAASEPPPPAPQRDVVVGDGGEIVLGDTRVRTFLVPGHTPGALGFIFPVKDHGKTRMAGLFGGLILVETRASDDNLRQYIESVKHFAAEAQRYKVDVELENHIKFDGTLDRLHQLSTQSGNGPNPFVVGQKSYQDFLTVISECVQATLAERK